MDYEHFDGSDIRVPRATTSGRAQMRSGQYSPSCGRRARCMGWILHLSRSHTLRL